MPKRGSAFRGKKKKNVLFLKAPASASSSSALSTVSLSASPLNSTGNKYNIMESPPQELPLELSEDLESPQRALQEQPLALYEDYIQDESGDEALLSSFNYRMESSPSLPDVELLSSEQAAMVLVSCTAHTIAVPAAGSASGVRYGSQIRRTISRYHSQCCLGPP